MDVVPQEGTRVDHNEDVCVMPGWLGEGSDERTVDTILKHYAAEHEPGGAS